MSGTTIIAQIYMSLSRNHVNITYGTPYRMFLYIQKNPEIRISVRGDVLIFSSYVGSDPTSTVHPKKYQEFQAHQKIFEIIATPKKSPVLYIDFKERP